MRRFRWAFRLGIRNKLVGIMSVILLTAAFVITLFATRLFSEDSQRRVQEANSQAAQLLADQLRGYLTSMAEKTQLIGATLVQSIPDADKKKLQDHYLELDKDLLAVSLFDLRGPVPQWVGGVTNAHAELFKEQKALPEKRLRSLTESISTTVFKSAAAETLALHLSLPLAVEANGKASFAVVGTFKQDRVIKSVAHSGVIHFSNYVVDSNGILIAHEDQARVLKNENLSELEIVNQMLYSKLSNGQTAYAHPKSSVRYLAAFQKVGFAGLGVIAEEKEETVLAPATRVKRASIFLTGIVAILAFLFVYFYSQSMTRPLIRLVGATEEVAQGNYDVHVKPAGKDEIGDLTRAFNQMSVGLAERERIKSAFNKFHSKEVAEKILQGDLTLTGERKKVTIFFSDVRSFTSISEKLPPEAVVELINSYMTRMVRIIFAHGGVVDKYVGDAIMALYGAPLSAEDDSLRAVAAALRMRDELKRFNAKQEAEGKPVIAIGMGIHTGEVVAGNIGSPERMEYTVIGDNVNLTSRLESSTKELSTDIVISQDTWEEIKDYIECKPRGTIKVKGKDEGVTVYEVVGFVAGYEYVPPEGSTGETLRSAPPPAPHRVVPPAPPTFAGPTHFTQAVQVPPPPIRRVTPPPPPADATLVRPKVMSGQIALEIPLSSIADEDTVIERRKRAS